ncbi:hypothetical protein EZV62_004638 [Acer yangbiense]|uniref:MULE transposase domain-containing protein n=1 Tax=Acer yangbiense TaxID=1000413 RepID=A0A5C7IK88_9ROSI|nr:hypothetical protein EZV62_004638 [Acer yangbiense]
MAKVRVNPMFERFVLSFHAMQIGFLKGCRPLIGLDGCHLSSEFGGVLLSAIAIDADGGIFSLAYCVFEWARHRVDTRIKSDHVTDNISECFNSWIKDDKDKSILTLMEIIRKKFMKTHGGKPTQEYLRENELAGIGEHEAVEKTSEFKPSDQLERTRGNPTREYLRRNKTVGQKKQTYGNPQGAPPDPPKKRNSVGRPKKSRKRAADEGLAPSKCFTKRCISYGAMGHNSRTYFRNISKHALDYMYFSQLLPSS